LTFAVATQPPVIETFAVDTDLAGHDPHGHDRDIVSVRSRSC
jgi:hypothetical protein